MKAIRYLLYMMLLMSNIEIIRGDYSIDTFLDYLQKSEYYNLIQTIKNIFGDDVAIDVCKELVKSNDCETVVKVYMTKESGTGPRPKIKRHIDASIFEEIIEYFENKYTNIIEEMKNLIEIIISYYNSLLENMNREEIIDFIEKIIKNPEILEQLEKMEK